MCVWGGGVGRRRGDKGRERGDGSGHAASTDTHLKETVCVKALVLVLHLSYSLAALSSTENTKMTHISAP